MMQRTSIQNEFIRRVARALDREMNRLGIFGFSSDADDAQTWAQAACVIDAAIRSLTPDDLVAYHTPDARRGVFNEPRQIITWPVVPRLTARTKQTADGRDDVLHIRDFSREPA